MISVPRKEIHLGGNMGKVPCITRFFYKQLFYEQHQAETNKKNKQKPTELSINLRLNI